MYVKDKYVDFFLPSCEGRSLAAAHVQTEQEERMWLPSQVKVKRIFTVYSLRYLRFCRNEK